MVLKPAASARSLCISMALMILLFFTLSLTTQAQVSETTVSTDPFTNSTSQHATEVEPSTFVFGNTIVSAFQQGRFPDVGGSSDNGWATSTDGGQTWHHGSLPGLTTYSGGTMDRISDAAVTYDAAHGIWLVGSLPLLDSGAPVTPMLISRSPDGLHWHNPVSIPAKINLPDKTWISCDNNTSSPFYGNCYAEFDDNSNLDTIYFSVSKDGGATWSNPVNPSGAPIGLGLEPLAQPSGNVIAAGADAFLQNVIAVTSNNGGTSWSSQVTVSSITYHAAAGGLRDLVLPSSAMDAAGTIYVVWQDCRFRSNCSSNDLVMSTSTDGKRWSAVQRIPIDSVTSGADHFIPGLAVEAGTSGSSAHLGLTYYYYPNANCSTSTCQLDAAYISSPDGGATWTTPTSLSGMKLSSVANSNQGSMVGDYESLAFVNGQAHPVFAFAHPKTGSTFHQNMDSPKSGLNEDLAVHSSADDKPVANPHSDHPQLVTPACDNCKGRD